MIRAICLAIILNGMMCRIIIVNIILECFGENQTCLAICHKRICDVKGPRGIKECGTAKRKQFSHYCHVGESACYATSSPEQYRGYYLPDMMFITINSVLIITCKTFITTISGQGYCYVLTCHLCHIVGGNHGRVSKRFIKMPDKFFNNCCRFMPDIMFVMISI